MWAVAGRKLPELLLIAGSGGVVACAILTLWHRAYTRTRCEWPRKQRKCVAILGDAYCDLITITKALPRWGGVSTQSQAVITLYEVFRPKNTIVHWQVKSTSELSHQVLSIVSDPRKQDSLLERPIEQRAGGSAMNIGIQLANLNKLIGRRDLSVVLHTAIGYDTYGQVLRDALKRTDVKLSVPRRRNGEEASTGVCICLSGPHDRSFLTYRGAIGTFAKKDIDLPLFYSSSAVYCAGYYNTPALWQDLPGMLAECRSRRIQTFLTPQYDATEEWRHIDKCLEHLDVFLPNELEACAISRKDGVEAAAQYFLDAGVKHVVVTLGAQGAYACWRDAEGRTLEFRCSAKPVKVVDSTGAGDAFASGFLYEFLRSSNVEAAVRYGCMLGTTAVTKVGASCEMTLEEIQSHEATDVTAD